MKGNEAEHRKNGQIQAHDDVAPNRADQAERDSAHDDQRLGVRAERNRQQRINQQQGYRESAHQPAERFLLLPLLAFERVCITNSTCDSSLVLELNFIFRVSVCPLKIQTFV